MSLLNNCWRRRVLAAVLVTVGVGGASLATASVASAADVTAPACGSVRPGGPMCYFCQSNYRGAQAGLIPNIPDLLSPTRWLFRGPGAGAGTQVANNAGSGHNRDSVCTYRIYARVTTETMGRCCVHRGRSTRTR